MSEFWVKICRKCQVFTNFLFACFQALGFVSFLFECPFMCVHLCLIQPRPPVLCYSFVQLILSLSANCCFSYTLLVLDFFVSDVSLRN